MASIENINKLLELLKVEFSNPVINAEKCILRLEQLSELINAIDHERDKAHQSEVRKDNQVKKLSGKIKEYEPIKQSLDVLTAHNGKLLRKIKRLENKAKAKRGK